uniref:Uncharacterized protein n=1 Tax=Anguilla anguilla TaxID=7936 RepID=A0A0E9WB59_ANGAN
MRTSTRLKMPSRSSLARASCDFFMTSMRFFAAKTSAIS